MRKLIQICCSILLLSGCQQAKSVPQETKPEPVVKEKETAWSIKLGLDIDDFQPLDVAGVSYVPYQSSSLGDVLLGLDLEKLGVGTNWYGMKYDPNAILVLKNNQQGVYDDQANVLFDFQIPVVTTPFRKGLTSAYDESGKMYLGYYDSSKKTANVFQNDFRSLLQGENYTFQYQDTANTKKPFFAVQNSQFGIAYVNKDENGHMKGWSFEQVDLSVDANFVVPVLNDAFSITGYVILNPAYQQVGAIASGVGTYQQGNYINGHYVLYGGGQAQVFAENGQQIGPNFEDALYFQNGYIPVKKFGKWGLMDEHGNIITDFIFEKLSPVINQKVYAKYLGQYGILDLRKDVNVYSIEDQEDTNEPLGKVEVLVSELVIRKGAAGMQGEKFGMSHQGAIYPYFEKQDADGYTWYRISHDCWIADQQQQWVKEQ